MWFRRMILVERRLFDQGLTVNLKVRKFKGTPLISIFPHQLKYPQIIEKS